MRFSVIIPLEFHRSHAPECITAWCFNQGVALDDYEILCMVPPDFPDSDLETVKSLLRPQDRIVPSLSRHDISLLAEGAEAAIGEMLFFTESHVIPGSGLLKECVEAFKKNPEWVALCCHSRPIAETRMAQAEAAMYEGDVVQALEAYPEGYILDQGFATLRATYMQTGGFLPELGHYAEWALSSKYRELGLKIGYASNIEVAHYYSGSVKLVREFTQDFCAGEVKYLSGDYGRQPGTGDVPPEWTASESRDIHFARSLVGAILRDAISITSFRTRGRDLKARLKELMRWLPPAAFGAAPAYLVARLVLFANRMLLEVRGRRGPYDRLAVRFKKYVSAAIHLERLECVAKLPGNARTEGLSRRCGFYGNELYQGRTFCWSEPAAGMDLQLEPGVQYLRLSCLPVRPLGQAGVFFWMNGSRLKPDQVEFDDFDVVLKVNTPGGTARLVWVCKRFEAPNDVRRLGLPIAGLSCSTDREKSPQPA